MEQKEIVRKLFEKGVLLSPQALSQITEEQAASLPAGATIVASLPEQRLTVKDIAGFYQEKYRGIRGLLLGKLSPLSISHAGKAMGEASVIGMVREKTPSGFVLEDPTGALDVRSTHSPGLGDVLGVTGVMREGALMEQEIMYPDVPLARPAKRGQGRLILSVQAGLSVRYEGTEATDIPVGPLPAWLQAGGTEILVCEGDGSPQEWLKKRHLPETIRSSSDPFIIEQVPDILWVVSGKNKAENYKGVLIVHTSGLARVDLATLQAEFVG